MLGWIATARGGLTAADLAHLTGMPLWKIEDILHAAAGRVFARRASPWYPDATHEVYLLSREDACTIYPASLEQRHS